MEEKLRRLMKNEGINSTRLAEILGIQASGISHIMSGRNKPSHDFTVKLLSRFPQINPDWLLLDKGPMYRDEIRNKTAGSVVSSAASSVLQPHSSNDSADAGSQSLFSSVTEVPNTPQISLERDEADIIPSGKTSAGNSLSDKFAPSSSIERIVVFYKDKTFSEYQPE